MTDVKKPKSGSSILMDIEEPNEKLGLLPRDVTLDVRPSPIEIIIERNLTQIANQRADSKYASLTRMSASSNLNGMSRWLFNSVS